MRFLAPLGFLFAAALPVIIAFYLLKLRRTRQDVPSTLLWRRAAEDMQANAPFQKLRRNLLLLIQLLIALLLVLGLARPFMNLKSGPARSVVLLIDNSASMTAGARGKGESRLDQAKEKVRQVIQALPPGGQAMIITFASKPSVACQFTSDRKRLEEVVSNIASTALPTHPDDAITLAQSLAKPARAEVIIFSDGAFTTSVPAVEGVSMRYVRIGDEGPNAGIVALDLRRPPESTREFEVFATIRNYGAEAMTPNLEIWNDGKLVDVRQVAMQAGQEKSEIFSSSRLSQGNVELKLVTEDTLAADNSAFAVIKPPRKKRVMLVSAGNYFLERAMSQERTREMEIVRVQPAQYSPEQTADVVVFDSFSPPPPLPPGNYLFINAVPSVEGFAQQGEEENPAIFDWDRNHSVMRYVELSDVQINHALEISLPQASHVLAESRDAPLISVYSAGNRNIVLWAFNIYETNLPLRVAFPILVSNSLDWLLNTAAPAESSIMRTGDVIQVDPPKDFKKARMTDPDGKVWDVPKNSAGRLLFDRTDRIGFYRLDIDDKLAETFGVSLIDSAESALTPRDQVSIAGAPVTAAKSELASNREIWMWFALAALGLVLLEWLIYHKRIWI